MAGDHAHYPRTVDMQEREMQRQIALERIAFDDLRRTRMSILAVGILLGGLVLLLWGLA